MNKAGKNNSIEIVAIVVLRFFIGWHILYEGISKLVQPNWSSKGFLSESKWVLSGISEWIIHNLVVLNVVDFLNTWGLMAIGAGLILGLFTRLASISGAALLLVYYMTSPPLIGLVYSIPMEGNNLVISKTLIEASALFVLAASPYCSAVGLDLLRAKFKKQTYKTEG